MSLPERRTFKAMKATGSTPAIIAAFMLILIWCFSGPPFHFSQNWLLIVITLTSIITFLMFFLTQKAHNKDSLAIQLKRNELVATHETADNKLVNVEHMPKEELKIIQQDYFRLREDGEENQPKTHLSLEKDSSRGAMTPQPKQQTKV